MTTYDPDVGPEPSAWLAMDENQRLKLVEQYHHRARIKLPRAKFHATIHMAVENRVAEGYEVVTQAMTRLRGTPNGSGA